MCKKLKVPLNPIILQRYKILSLSTDDFEICFDEISTDELSTLPRILKSLKIKSIKLWTRVFENTEFSKLGARKSRPKKDLTINSESSAILSRQITGICDNIQSSTVLHELSLFGLNFSVKNWARLGTSLETSKIKKLILQKSNISEKELEVLFQPIGSMKNLKILDLSLNKLKDSSGYLIGRIIGKQGERRDTYKWEVGLRGSIADTPEGLSEIYLNHNLIGDIGWEKMVFSLVSDSWVKLIDAKSNGITSASFKPTQEVLEHNKTILILDLRDNSEFAGSFIKILELIDKNFDYLNKNTDDSQRYMQLFEYICNDIPLPYTYSIGFINDLQQKSKNKSPNKTLSVHTPEKQNSSSYIAQINEECEMLRVENKKLREKLKIPNRRIRKKLKSFE
jgi:hypothetical protein